MISDSARDHDETVSGYKGLLPTATICADVDVDNYGSCEIVTGNFFSTA